MNLEPRWSQTWTSVGALAPGGLFEQIRSAYSEPHRAYHTTQHLSECFEHLDHSPLQPSNPAAVELALWFHDAIYDTKAGDNEEKSAKWASEALAALPASLVNEVQSLVLVTKHDAAPATRDEELLLDIDLSILGAPTERFDQYESQIRHEFAWVPKDAYSTARSRILRQFDERRVLYATDHFRANLEPQARKNLRRSLEALAV